MRSRKDDIDEAEKKGYNRPNLTGTYSAKLDSKKRIKIPKPLVDSIISLNDGERSLYLRKEDDKILGFPLPAIEKFRKEYGDLPLTDSETRKKMEELGSSLHETAIKSDERIVIPDKILSIIDVKPNSEVTIKGAFDFITISKK